ncbi:AAA family ATPase [Corallococcus exiguus]|uniref:Uncharacterized protein n=1 Tax=Corallococcus exiguus TaxID=83462 RepID=A0A7X4Y406_9BACT|nr:ATP-binding protein [Corallococcus exiguus]NBC38330.1 hypothetical protein [Corallococcus exiguus]TNV55781.1 hypothetical protein FH620_31085 [Corallococcus exiguus]
MPTLTRLTIRHFRNVIPTTLEFRPDINVLLGGSQTGKTTLLRLLSTVVDHPDEALKDDPFDVSWRIAKEQLELECAMTRPRTESATDESGASRFPRTFSCTLTDHGTEVLKGDIGPDGTRIERDGRTEHHRYPLVTSPFTILRVVLSKHDAPMELRYRLITFSLLTAGRLDEGLEGYHALLDLEGWRMGVHGAWNLRAVPSSFRDLLDTDPIGTTLTFTPEFLTHAVRALGFDSASARFDIERLPAIPSGYLTQLRNLRFVFKHADEEIPHDLLAPEEKLLLAFFAHADASRTILIADEPMHGFHFKWVTDCLRQVGNRQMFLTNQNPLLLDVLRFGSAEDVRRTFTLCKQAHDESGARLVWRNPTEDEAESFFQAHLAGGQSVSEILRAQGLW